MIECENLPFAVHDQAQSYGLYTSCRKLRLDLSPEYRRQFESYKTVENSTCLLGIDQIHVDLAWVFDGVEDGRLCNLLKNNSFGILFIELQSLEKMP